ncbi:dihydroxyacetone kinase subunit DhaK [Brevibacillus sp. B_LB10_24]|uniref:dihydroxyacetone kinase subunit DhaK n=1 Tax=Brevibacillus sp. B_LB10_24 TaxID=3380645 RepID=UPI0038B8585D
MKKIINNPHHVVTDMLIGLAKANPNVSYSEGFEVIFRKHKSAKVGVISGGGAGHEPAHAGYVGKGMLDASVTGNVFASPSPDRILEAIQQADSGNGVLMVIMNYSGDNMNFQMAGELAEMEGIKVELVVVKDDVAVPDSTFSTGRRGIAGTVFVNKVAGAKADQGASLSEVKAVAEKAIQNVRSMGMAMTHCTLPGVERTERTLADDEMEIGMGIHGEPGVHRVKMLSAAELAKRLTDDILNDLDYTGSEVAVMVNGLGGTPLMELYILYNEVEKQLQDKNISIYKSFVGNYMTSFEMAGSSVTLLKLDDELKELLDYPCDTPALKI